MKSGAGGPAGCGILSSGETVALCGEGDDGGGEVEVDVLLDGCWVGRIDLKPESCVMSWSSPSMFEILGKTHPG